MTNNFQLLVTTVFFIYLNKTANTLQLPSNFKICKRNDPNLFECINEAASQNIIQMANGLKEFNIPPLEPLSVDNLSIGSTGVVVLQQNYSNIKVYGLTKGLKVSKYDVNFDKLIFKSESLNPLVSFVADYSIFGRILLLPIRGSGLCNITMVNLTTKNYYYGENFVKDGESFISIKKYIVKFSPGKILINFENLFDGDSFFGRQMNKFLNDNSDLLFGELREPFEKSFSSVFKKISNQLFSKVPFNQLLPM